MRYLIPALALAVLLGLTPVISAQAGEAGKGQNTPVATPGSTTFDSPDDSNASISDHSCERPRPTS